MVVHPHQSMQCGRYDGVAFYCDNKVPASRPKDLVSCVIVVESSGFRSIYAKISTDNALISMSTDTIAVQTRCMCVVSVVRKPPAHLHCQVSAHVCYMCPLNLGGGTQCTELDHASTCLRLGRGGKEGVFPPGAAGELPRKEGAATFGVSLRECDRKAIIASYSFCAFANG